MENKKQITKEDFYNLSQLDRIEYRQRLELIEKERIEVRPFGFLNSILLIVGFVFLVALGMYNISPHSFVIVLNLIPLIFRVGISFFIFLVILDLIFSHLNNKKKRELINEYFPLEIKRGKKK
jgi:hypothetical protein